MSFERFSNNTLTSLVNLLISTDLEAEKSSMSVNVLPELNTVPIAVNGRTTSTKGHGPPYQLGDEMTMTCDPGFARNQTGKSTVILDNGVLRWEPETLTCIPIPCPDPPILNHSHPHQPIYTFRQTFQYVCNDGYKLTEPEVDHECTASSEWFPPISNTIRCVPVECPFLGNPLNGTVWILSRLFQSMVRYECDPNYVITGGDQQRICQNDGTWSGKEATCGLPTASQSAPQPAPQPASTPPKVMAPVPIPSPATIPTQKKASIPYSLTKFLIIFCLLLIGLSFFL